jgi:hypothetical protein
MPRSNDTEQPAFDPMQAFLALQERMLAIQEQQAAALQVQVDRTAPKENPNYTPDSIFLRSDGEEWSKTLPYDIFLGPHRLNETPLTQAEVEQLARIRPIEKARVEKTDGSIVLGKVYAREDAVGRIDRMTIEFPMKKDDNPQMYPILVRFAQQLADQSETVAA